MVAQNTVILQKVHVLLVHLLKQQDSKNAGVSFFSMCACQKGSRSQSFLAETVKTGHKNCGVTGAMHVL